MLVRIFFGLMSLMNAEWMSTGFAEPWEPDNDPKLFRTDYEYRWSALPQGATLSGVTIPWADTYWPSYLGSINYRWNAENPVGFGYEPPSRSQAMRMTRSQLESLSPAEKYDLAMGNEDYPLFHEAKRHANPRARDWVGICHGWAPASIQFKEPAPVEVINPDGVSIPFGSSDVKGLMSYFFAFHGGIRYSFIGLRCALAKMEGKMNGLRGSGLMTSCSDVNPGAFHVVLANEIGIRHQAFIADIDRDREIWNQPIYGYEMKPVASVLSSSADSAVLVKLTLYYTDELDKPLWAPVAGTSQFPVGRMELEYELELDRAGKITGGTWRSAKWPDFLWRANSAARFSGDFSGLNQIYRPAVRATQ